MGGVSRAEKPSRLSGLIAKERQIRHDDGLFQGHGFRQLERRDDFANCERPARDADQRTAGKVGAGIFR